MIGVFMASPDHAATVREAIMGGHLPPDPATWLDYRLNACDALDALVADLAQARKERDEARDENREYHDQAVRDYKRINRAERQRDQATQALREIAGMGARFDAKGTHSKRVVEIAREALAAIEKDTA